MVKYALIIVAISQIVKGLKKWVEFIHRKYTDTEFLYVSGISMGSSTVLMASYIIGRVDGIIADCGYTSPKEQITFVAKRNYKFMPRFLISFVGLLAKIFGKFDYRYSAEESLSKTCIPVMFIHGLKDDFVPSYMTDKNYDACSSKKEKVLVEDATHGMALLYDWKKVTMAVEKFMKEIENK